MSHQDLEPTAPLPAGRLRRAVAVAAARVGGAGRATARCLRRAFGGPEPGPSTYGLSSWLFLRLLGLIYLVAIVSFWTQADGLVGARGILPAAEYLEAVRHQLGTGRFVRLPTLCWWLGAGDGAIDVLCAAGAACALMLVAGAAPHAALLCLWAVYLSISVAGGVFMSFQWDALLLEAGFLALFIAPARLLPSAPGAANPNSLARWLLWWLLFKLMFLSGITKLLSGDPTWRDLSALSFHYETQPLPTWPGWWAHQLPPWFQQASAGGMYAAEIGLPFLIFAWRRLRHLAAAGLVLFQGLIGLTGNYCFFGLLTAALCVLLIDDRFWRGVLPARWRSAAAGAAEPPRPAWVRRAAGAAAALVMLVSVLEFTSEMVRTVRRAALPRAAAGALRLSDRMLLSWGEPLLLQHTAPFRTINGYGLFRVMTTERIEIAVEGSRDGVTWRPYEFRWKPGDPARRPRFVEPHQPRLDWQMWFAALDPRGNAPWLERLMLRLLEGSEPVLGLLGQNLFPDGPPRFLRLSRDRYRFTDAATRAATGHWWRREALGPLSRPISLPAGGASGPGAGPRQGPGGGASGSTAPGPA